MSVIADRGSSSFVVCHWDENPSRLVSWLDMEQFSARIFYFAGRSLEKIKTDCLLKPAGTSGQELFHVSVLYQPLDQETKNNALSSLIMIERECRTIGTSITADTIEEVIDHLNKDSELTFQWLMTQIGSIQNLLHKEMSGRVFLYLPPERAKFWPKVNEVNIFGQSVADSFPSATFDIQQAGIALATRLSTACVFHLMRAMEIVLGVLGSKFGVSLAHTNWAPAIEQIESRIRDMHKNPAWKSLPDCKNQQEFFSQAASHFGVLKDAWRNYTMHSRGKYTEEEAEQIFNNVKGFTQKLAEKLSE